MHTTRQLARRAGLLYVLAGSVAPFAYLYVPRTLVVPGDPLATVEKVREAEGLLRAAVVSELAGATLLLFAARALYELFEPADRRTSWIVAAMMLASVPISFVNALSHVASLLLLDGSAIASLLGPGEVAARVTLSLRLHAHGLFVNQILWGLWLFPIGVLVLRSGFFPRWLAYPLFLAGGGYVLNSLGVLLLPPSLRSITGSLQILGIGELPFFSFYLLIWGAHGHPVDRVAAAIALAFFSTGSAALVLLLLGRIGALQYGALMLVPLALVVALVSRWRSAPGRAADAAPPP